MRLPEATERGRRPHKQCMMVSDPLKCHRLGLASLQQELPVKTATNRGIFRKFHLVLFLLTAFSQLLFSLFAGKVNFMHKVMLGDVALSSIYLTGSISARQA